MRVLLRQLLLCGVICKGYEAMDCAPQVGPGGYPHQLNSEGELVEDIAWLIHGLPSLPFHCHSSGMTIYTLRVSFKTCG